MTRRTGADDGQLGFFDLAAQAVTDFFGSATRAEPEEPELDGEDEQDAEDADDLARAADTLLGTLRGMGLQHVRALVLTRNRSVVVSLKGYELRLHEGFCTAPVEIHAQIVRFVMARRSWERQTARAAILAHPLPKHTKPPRAPERTHPDDEEFAERLAEWHTRLNGERFGAQLQQIQIRVSRRMVRRLGHYAPGVEGGGAEIAVSARHIRRDGFASAVDTLLHEMVHQWQHENGHPIDHGLDFRCKCREVGALPRAKRPV
jgi:chemotaxis protein histidine kinase CheA